VVLAALLFAVPAHGVTIDWVTVGDQGNPADTEVMSTDGTTGYGSVPYAYEIARHPTTNAQYAAFLNAVAATDGFGLCALDDWEMGSGYGGITQDCSSGSCTYSTIAGRENMPVIYVSFYDALRTGFTTDNPREGRTARRPRTAPTR
jgi:formylglycine-generating enzyme required for sulfatase activity